MIATPLRHLLMFPLFLLLSAAPALAEDWVIVKVSGEAWISNPNAPVARATVGMSIPDGATFSTSHNARAHLKRGAESILVSPDTVISSQSYTFFGTNTTIRQQVGRIELDVEKRTVRHFSVKTPLLAAVVKGTHFTVSVSRTSADVQVARGLVEVTDMKTGTSAEVPPGQKAVIGGPGGRGLQVTGINDPVEPRKGRGLGSDDESNAAKGQSGSKAGTGNPSSGPGKAGSENNGGGKGNSGSGGPNGNAGNNGNGGAGGGSGPPGGGNAGGSGSGKGGDNGNGHGSSNGNGGGKSDPGQGNGGRDGSSNGKGSH